jgi:HlyD family secretion protein
MKGKRITLILGALAIGAGAVAFLTTRGGEEAQIEYRYASAETGELMRSISATGQVVALTKVDVKSKAGGIVVRLAVDEGDYVRRGDLIAVIDPADTQAVVEQASADLVSANARAAQADSSYKLQQQLSQTEVADAQSSLESAKIRLQRLELQSKRQPEVSDANVRTAAAAVREAEEAKRRLEEVEIPARRREAQAALNRSKAELDAAEADLRRQQQLLDKGYVAGSVVERARAQTEAARSSHALADQRMRTIEQEIRAAVTTADTTVARANAALRLAEANSSDDQVREIDVAEARQAVRSAEISLRRAKDNLMQIQVRRSEAEAARAATVRNKVTLDNARVQLASTTVVAPRDGVVTMKYLEEGTIIPAGTSTFSQGPSIVELSDTTQLFVECAVDEADIGNVKPGQKVRVSTDAFRGRRLEGVVERINPAAQTEQNITAIKVRVRILPNQAVPIKPGMNATCEFITLDKQDVLLVPSQAIRNENGKTFVRIKTDNPLQPMIREVQVGEEGNEGVEILAGIKAGDEVVVAEIDLVAMRELQKKIQETQEGTGGLAGGGGPPRRR